MSTIKHRCVLITGGASGIGKLLALRCLEEGAYQVILWDINEAKLRKTQAEFTALGYQKIDYQVVDVSKLEAIEKGAKELEKRYTTIDILFNNAGIVVGKAFAEHSHQDINRSININVSGVMHTTLAFIGNMIDQGEGHIINIASASGLLSNPNMSVYAGSKWAVLGWSDSIRLEMQEQQTGVQVTTVVPSYINTGMFDGVKAPLLTPILEPNYIVEKIIEAVKENKEMVVEPMMTKYVPLLKGLLPRKAFDFLAGRIFGVYNSMDNFKGH